MRNKTFRILGNDGLSGPIQFCNGPLQNWILNTHRSLHPPVHHYSSQSSAHTSACGMKKVGIERLGGPLLSVFVRGVNHSSQR
jgi:hypothetical protein